MLNDGSGTNVGADPIRKWPGVKTSRSSGSSVSGVKGRELSIASICAKRVDISSYMRRASPITLRKWCFTDFTPASHFPPKCGADGGLNFQFVPSLANNEASRFDSVVAAENSRFNSASAPIRLVPQSNH